MKNNWHFQYCSLNRTIDGDSLVLDVKTGFYHTAEVHVRLLGVDTPDRNKDPEGWRMSRAYTDNWLAESGGLTFTCTGADKYGRRWLGVIRNTLGESLGDALINSGLGVVYVGGKKP